MLNNQLSQRSVATDLRGMIGLIPASSAVHSWIQQNYENWPIIHQSYCKNQKHYHYCDTHSIRIY